jgi:asparagine synthase (glutamine-hydrolysing)
MLAAIRRSDKLRLLAPLLPQPDVRRPPSRWQRLLARAHHSRATEAVTLGIQGFPGDVRHPRGLNPDQLRRLREATDIIARSVYRRQRDLLGELLSLDLDWQLAESLLQKADKMSMGASIELRTPILDLGVAGIAARVSSALKLPPGGPGKMVLRHCLAKKLNETMDRPKRGFPVPLAQWFAGPLREPLEAAIFASDAACLNYLERPLLRAAWEDFLAEKWDGASVLYALWLYEVWNRKFSG